MCLITTGYNFPCRTNQGGIANVYIGTFNGNTLSATIGTTGASASTISGWVSGTVSHYTVAQRVEQGSFVQNFTGDIVSGTTMYEGTVEITVEQVGASLTNWLNLLGQGVWRILIQDNLGQYYYLGYKNGCYVTSIAGGAGKAFADGNKAVITFASKEPVGAYLVTSAAAAAIITA
jgi:hypothetical protein